jgi:hypothetical protein
MRRFVELGSTAAWDGRAVIENACARTSHVAEAMASEKTAMLRWMATALGEASGAPAKWQQILGESIGAVMASTRGASAVFASAIAPAALYRADIALSQVQEALENTGASDSLDESAEQWARDIAQLTALAGWRGPTVSAHASFAEAFHAYTSLELVSPYWECLSAAGRTAQFNRVQQRAAWLLVTSARRRIRDTVRHRLRVRQTDERLQLDIVTVQIAYFLNHGCHPPALQRSCETLRDAARTC